MVSSLPLCLCGESSPRKYRSPGSLRPGHGCLDRVEDCLVRVVLHERDDREVLEWDHGQGVREVAVLLGEAGEVRLERVAELAELDRRLHLCLPVGHGLALDPPRHAADDVVMEPELVPAGV